jgi:hypothetical protein
VERKSIVVGGQYLLAIRIGDKRLKARFRRRSAARFVTKHGSNARWIASSYLARMDTDWRRHWPSRNRCNGCSPMTQY